jgi:hypothetical protein
VIEDILARLDKVRRTGSNNWIACCPAHDDRSPSMTLHAADDGRQLVHCKAGCSFEEIVSAVGLGWDPWFAPKQKADFLPAVRRPYPASDVLETLAHEILIVRISANDFIAKREISEEDWKRLRLACNRIDEARRIAIGER